MKKIGSLLLIPAMVFAFSACAQKKIPVPTVKNLSKYSIATFASGCFWHEEALFESLKGVQDAVSGYAGGNTKNPSYEMVETGNTGHAETVNVYYDSSIITYPTLLKIFFAGQYPTQVNGQGNDLGTQYRTIVFYRNNTEKQLIGNYIKSIQPKYKQPIAAQIMPFTKFWQAEDYHQNYVSLNPTAGYVQSVCVPEIIDVQKEYPQLIKADHIF